MRILKWHVPPTAYFLCVGSADWNNLFHATRILHKDRPQECYPYRRPSEILCRGCTGSGVLLPPGSSCQRRLADGSFVKFYVRNRATNL